MPATTTRPTPTSANANPRLKPKTRTRPLTVLPTESARSMTLMDAGQGTRPPAAPKATTCHQVGRVPVPT